jgi:hemerythrin-like domain-containing protein
MLQEHTAGRTYLRGMADALQQLRNAEEAHEAFAEHALGYVDLLRAHIDKENNILFVMAERMLPATVHTQLSSAFEEIEEERIGRGAHARYQTWLHLLREAYRQHAA